MAAGPELNEFQDNLRTTTKQMEIVRQDVEALGAALDSAATVSKSYLNFRKIIKVLDAGFSAALTTLKLSENVAPLKVPSAALKDVLEILQPRIADIKDATDRAQRIEPLLDLIDDASDAFNFTVKPAINSADETLDNVLAGINEFVDAFDRVSTPNGIPSINPDASTERPGKDDFMALIDRADDYVAFANGANGAAQSVFGAYDGSKALLNEVTGLFDIVDFPDLNAVLGRLSEFEDLFEGLGVVLDIVEGALRPIQPLLDSVGAVFDITVTPVVDFLIDSIGVDEIFDALAEQLDPLFPDINLFDNFLDVADRLEEMLAQIDVDQFDIPDFTDEALEVFDRFTLEVASKLNGIPLRIGDAESQTMIGTGGNEAFDPRGGNDVVQANAGNNIIVASAGDDTITGGSGVDRLVFAGELVEYEFTRNDDTGELIFTHTDVGSHGFNEGSEVVTDVEYFDFGTETFTKEQFETAITGMSVLNGTDEGELIFLLTDGALISGLTLNGKTFDNMNVVYGLGGDDRIQGTLRGNDFIFGGAGNDLLVPRGGKNALDGGPGIDTFQVFDTGFGTLDRIDLAAGTAFVTRRDTAELANVENVIVQHSGSIRLNGSDQGNVLFTGRGGDLISGRAGDDALFGNAGRDVLFGGIGVDTLRGGDQGDYLGALNTSDNGPAELYDGEAGIDTLSYSTSQGRALDFLDDDLQFTGALTEAMRDAAPTGPVVVRAALGEVDRLNANGGVIATDIALNIEEFLGSDSDDVLYGGGDILNQISINGSGGNDVLYSWGSQGVGGGGGDDLLIAERGPDGGRVAGGFSGGGGFDTLDLTRLGDVRFIIEGSATSGLVIVRDKGYAGGLENSRSDSFNTSGISEYLLGDNDDVVEWAAKTSPTFRGGQGNDYMSSLSEMSNSNKSPQFYGDEGDDTIVLAYGGSAFGGAGNDRIEVAAFGEMFAQGGAGNDVFVISQMTGNVTGGEGFDTLIIDQPGTDGVAIDLPAGTVTAISPNVIGSDKIRLTGITGIEAVITSDERDTVTGSDDADRISLRGGRDVAEGGGGNDQIFGGAANDSLMGGAGNDTINGGTGNDTIHGGSGIDAVDYALASPDGVEGELIALFFGGATVDLAQNTGGRGNEVDTISFVENVFGTVLNDKLSGDAQDNVLSGGAGADTLEGRDGDDVLIAGGLGVQGAVDVLSGGDGDDTFVLGAGAFYADGGAGSDTLDFSGGSDAADGGGRTLSIDVDLSAGTVQRDLELGRVVWAEGGGLAPRSFDGQSITPIDVLRSDPLYARASSDQDLRLPTGEEGAGDVPSFAITVETFEQSAPIERDAFRDVENLRGTALGDVLRGDANDNTLEGAAGEDLMEGRRGDDVLDGGDGRDTAVYSGGQTSYTVQFSRSGTTITDRRASQDGTDALVDIETLQFADSAFDIGIRSGAVGLSAEDFAAITELYIAYFDRAPAAKGLLYWATRLDDGMTLPEIAESFFVQPETQRTYAAYLDEDGNVVDTEAFVSAVFNNVLGRDPTGPYWIDELDRANTEITPALFILAVLNGAKAETGGAADAAYLETKTDVGVYFSAIKGLSEYDDTVAVMNLYDGSAASVTNAVAEIDRIHAEALDPNTGEYLMPLVGVIDDPFAVA